MVQRTTIYIGGDQAPGLQFWASKHCSRGLWAVQWLGTWSEWSIKVGEGVPGTHGDSKEMERANKELDIDSFYSWENESTANPPLCQGFLWDIILVTVTLLQMGEKGQRTPIRKIHRCLKITRVKKTLRKRYVLKENFKTPLTWKKCPMVGTMKCAYFLLHYCKKSTGQWNVLSQLCPNAFLQNRTWTFHRGKYHQSVSPPNTHMVL